MQFKIKLSTTEQVKEFVNICSAYNFDIDLTIGRYTVNAKSIMGIFSLDLSEELLLELSEKTPSTEAFITEIHKFIIS